MRFYEFYEGQILIDDYDIREYPLEELRKKMGLVLQDAFLFYGDIAGNIRMMNPAITDEQIRHAAEFVQANKFIDDYQKDITQKWSNTVPAILVDNDSWSLLREQSWQILKY